MNVNLKLMRKFALRRSAYVIYLRRGGRKPAAARRVSLFPAGVAAQDTWSAPKKEIISKLFSYLSKILGSGCRQKVQIQNKKRSTHKMQKELNENKSRKQNERNINEHLTSSNFQSNRILL